MFVVHQPTGKIVHIVDPNDNNHITDLKPLFPVQTNFYLSRTRRSVDLIDLKNRSIETLVRADNSDLFCEKLSILNDKQSTKFAYVNCCVTEDETYVSEITLTQQFLHTLRSAASI